VAHERFSASTERSSGGRHARPPHLLSDEWSLLGLRFLVVISQALDAAAQSGVEHEPPEVSLRVAAFADGAGDRTSARRQCPGLEIASNDGEAVRSCISVRNTDIMSGIRTSWILDEKVFVVFRRDAAKGVVLSTNLGGIGERRLRT
jgi:hypothetical protein